MFLLGHDQIGKKINDTRTKQQQVNVLTKIKWREKMGHISMILNVSNLSS